MLHTSALAGACAGLVSSIVTCPLDVVKTRLQAQSGRRKTPRTSGWSGPAGHPNGGIGGAVAREAKVRSLQQPPVSPEVDLAALEGRYDGLRGTIRKIWTEDGLRGFYRGLGPTIFGYLPTWAIYFTVYDQCKTVLASTINPNGEEDFFNHILSAMTAGMASTCCTSPLWVVKTRFMLQSVKDPTIRPYRHTGDAFVQIYKTEGWKGFYRGLLPSLFGVSHVAVQFPLYESFKGWAREQDGLEDLSPGVILTCSSSAKMIASVLTYPHEVLRTRLQMQPRLMTTVSNANIIPQQQHNRSIHTSTIHRAMRQIRTTPSSSSSIATAASLSASTSSDVKSIASPLFSAHARRRRGIADMAASVDRGSRYTGVLQACATIAREEGIRGFYKGMGVNLIRTVPSSALTILTYEVMMQHLNPDMHEHDHDDVRHEGE